MSRKLLLAGILIIIVLVSFGCGFGGAEKSEGIQTSYSNDGSGGYYTPAPTITTTAIMMSTGSSKSHEYASDIDFTTDRMIIRTGNMYLVVEDVSSAMQQIISLADVYGGFVVDSNSWKDNERMMGNISIRVDSARFYEAVAALRSMAVEVRSENTSGQDVTEEYVDLQARLTTLEASESQLLTLMEEAGTVEEILGVQKELTNTRTQIEQIKGRMQYLEQSSALSLISVSLEQSKLVVEFTAGTRTVKEGQEIAFNPEVSGGFTPYTYEWDFGDGETSTEWNPVHRYGDNGSYTVKLTVTDDRGNTKSHERENYITVNSGWNAGSVAGSAWDGLKSFGRVLLNILIWLGIFSPVWIVILVVIFLVVRRRKKISQN